MASIIQSWSGTNKASNNNVPLATAGQYRAGYSYIMVVVFDNLTTTTPSLNASNTFKPTDASWSLVTSWDSPQSAAAGGVRGEVWLMRVPPTSLGASWGAGSGGASLSAVVTAKVVTVTELLNLGALHYASAGNASVTNPGFPGAGYFHATVYGSEFANTISGGHVSAATSGGNAQTNVSTGVSFSTSSGVSGGGTISAYPGTVDGGVALVIFAPEVESLDVSGQVDVVSATSGDITTNAPVAPVAVSGTVDVISATSGDVNVSHPVSGTVAVDSASSGVVNTVQPVSGTVAVDSTSSGAVNTVQPVSGTVAVDSATSGDITVTSAGSVAVSGTVDVISTSSGAINTIQPVSGTVVVDSTTSGAVNTVQPVSGTVAVDAASSGAVNTVQPVSGTVDVISATSADVTTTSAGSVSVSGTISVDSTSSGAINSIQPVSGTVAVDAASSGAVNTVQPVSGTVDVISATSGNVTTASAGSVAVSGTVDVVSASSGAVNTVQSVSGNVDVVADSSAIINTVQSISGTVAVVSTTSADVSVILAGQAAGTVSVVSATSGNINTIEPVSGEVSIEVITSADVTTNVTISGTVAVTSTTSANFTIVPPAILPISGTVEVFSGVSLVLGSEISARISWSEGSNRLYEIGLDRGVFYPQDAPGVPWNGLLSVNEASVSGQLFEIYQDGTKFTSEGVPDSFAATLEAFHYPTEFEPYSGQVGHVSGQYHKPFGLSYRTLIGNAETGTELGYKIHIVYNAFASPSPRNYQTMNDSVSLAPFSWGISTKSIKMGDAYSAHMVIDSRFAHAWTMTALEDLLYGSVEASATLPPPEDILELFEEGSILRITDHGDGTWTAEGPDEAITMLTSTMFEITWPSAVYIDTETYKISSL